MGLSSERVTMRPPSHGTVMSPRVFWASWSGKPKRVKEAGGGSVSQAASMVASLTFCTWPTS